MNEREVMTLPEVANYLQLAEKTVLRMVQRGEIPAAKVASQWRFLRPVIRDWLAGRMQNLSEPCPAPASATGPDLGAVIREDLIRLDIQPGPKEAVLRQLVEPLRATGFAVQPDALLVSLLERERLMTTAVGHGIAIPHPRRPLPRMFRQPGIVVGVCRAGTPFDAIDDQYVHVFFLICATREPVHLNLMAKIAWMGRQPDLVQRLRACRNVQAAKNTLMNLTEPLTS